MDVRFYPNVSVLFILVVVFVNIVISLQCKRCSYDQCTEGRDIIEECRPEQTDCATSILRQNVGFLKANSVLERYCYTPGINNRQYRKNTPHCQRNDAAPVEVCVCQGDLCNEKLPRCRLRNYGRGKGCTYG